MEEKRDETGNIILNMNAEDVELNLPLECNREMSPHGEKAIEKACQKPDASDSSTGFIAGEPSDNNNNINLLEKVSDQIQSFEYSQDPNETYSLSWQTSRVIYQNEAACQFGESSPSVNVPNQYEGEGMESSAEVPSDDVNQNCTSASLGDVPFEETKIEIINDEHKDLPSTFTQAMYHPQQTHYSDLPPSQPILTTSKQLYNPSATQHAPDIDMRQLSVGEANVSAGDAVANNYQEVPFCSGSQPVANTITEATSSNNSQVAITSHSSIISADNAVNVSHNQATVDQHPSEIYTVHHPHIINMNSTQNLISTPKISSILSPSTVIDSSKMLSNSNTFNTLGAKIIKTEPTFSSGSNEGSALIKNGDALEQNSEVVVKEEPKTDSNLTDMCNVQLPPLSTLPPFSSTREFSFTGANVGQLNLIAQNTAVEESAMLDSSRFPIILSNQPTILPSLLKIPNSNVMLNCTSSQHRESNIATPLLSSASFTTLTPSSTTADQPYILIPVCGNQQLLAFASSISDNNLTTSGSTMTHSSPTDSTVNVSSENIWTANPTISPANQKNSIGSTTRPTAVKSHTCNICGKQFSSRAVHNLHMRSHSGEKPYSCTVCGRHFSQKTSLTRHMRSHTGERPYPCEICGKCFSDKERVKIHLRSHTGEKPFPCLVCGKHFSQKSTVKRHMSVHTGERPFKCETCGKGFANKGNLNSHLRTHTVIPQ